MQNFNPAKQGKYDICNGYTAHPYGDSITQNRLILHACVFVKKEKNESSRIVVAAAAAAAAFSKASTQYFSKLFYECEF